MRRIFPYFLLICFLFTGCSKLAVNDIETNQVMQTQNVSNSKTAADSGIEIVAKRPYIKRGEIGVLALRCAPNAACRIVAVYKISGKEYRTTRSMIAGRDGSILCVWKVSNDTDVGTYNIEITSGGSRVVTNYVVQ